MNRTENNKGFTIIEVVLVLAIAGLIFLMVFIALPALQRSQRDTQRRSDVSRVSTQLTNFATANRGAIPTAAQMAGATGFPTKYLGGTGAVAGDEYKDPSGTNYTITTTTADPTSNQMNYQPSRICGTDGAAVTGTARQYVIRVKLEAQAAPYCVDNR